MWQALWAAIGSAATSDASGGGAAGGSGGGWFGGERSIKTPNEAYTMTPNTVTYNKGLDFANPVTMIGLAAVVVAVVWVSKRK